MKSIDLVGLRLGRLLVVERSANSPSGKCRFLCVCDCGTEKVILATHLSRGKIKSCGCYRIEFGREIGSSYATHRMTDTPEYQCWANMKDRCYNENNKSYSRYGGRGIRVCDRWCESFEAFYEDMGPRPSRELSIERVDNDQHYERSNCVWATRSQQQQNKSPFKHKRTRRAISDAQISQAKKGRRQWQQYP